MKILAILTMLFLVGCGAGGSSTSSTSDGTSTTTTTTTATAAATVSLSGTAATGLALSGASIDAVCSNGATGSATSGTDGAYTLSIASAVQPCILKATDSSSGETYYSVAASGTTTANITPLSHLVVTNALGSDPSSSFNASTASGISSTTLATAVTSVQSSMSSLGISISGINPLTTTLTAALSDSGLSTDSQDKAIDQLMATMSAAKISITSTGATTSGNSTNFSQLMYSSGTTSTAVSSAVTSLVTAQNNSGNIISTSALSGCPYAKSGQFVTYDVGGTQTNFGLIMINFGSSAMSFKPSSSSATITIPANTMRVPNKTGPTGVTTDLTITSPSSSTPCKFRGQQNSTDVVEFHVSPSGFIVGTPFQMPATTASSSSSNTLTSDNFFGIGIPVQSGIALSDLTGIWNLAGWGQLTAGSAYTNSYERAVLTLTNGILSGTSFSCDGGTNCSSTASGTFTMAKCTTCLDLGGNQLNNIFTATGAGTSLKTAGFRAPNGDLIGMMIGTSSTGGSSGFNRYFAMVLKTNNAAKIPTNGTTNNRASWILSSNNTGTNTLTMTNRVFNNSTLTSNSVRQTYTNTADLNCIMDITFDSPRIGMISRSSTNVPCSTTPFVGLRGNGWSVVGGTTLINSGTPSTSYPNIASGLGRFYSIAIIMN